MKKLWLLIIISGLLLIIITDLKADVNRVQVGNSSLQLEFKGHFTNSQKQMLNQWIHEMATAVVKIYGEFPLNRVRVRLVRSYSWREPVPWGEIERWRRSRVVLHVNPNFDYETIRADWTAVHELSHLLLPYVGSSDSWFSEGLASYYQNIARGKAGLLSEQDTFQKLFHGFRRGEANATRRPVPLAEASRGRGSTKRIYWSGAVYFLNVDVKLRRLSKGQKSLDSVLMGYKNCCLPNHRVRPLAAVMQRLDEISETKIFTEEYKKIINSKLFPSYDDSFEYLGIETGWRGVSLKQQARYQARRAALLEAN